MLLKETSLKGASEYSMLCLLQSIQKTMKEEDHVAMLLFQKILKDECDISTHRATFISILVNMMDK